MKKWFRFFFLGFFSHKDCKEGVKRGYTNVFFAFVLALTFLWAGFIGGEMLPFGVHFNNSPNFKATAHAVFANDDVAKRIVAQVEDGSLKVKKQGGDYVQELLVNTFESDADKQDYSANGFDVVVDSRPSNTLAEITAYCVSNDGNNTVISYEDYLTLSQVAKLNFDFKLTYTGNALQLTDEMVASYKQYAEGLSEENKSAIAELGAKLAEKQITQSAYDKAVYELYFTNYYPEITAYESTSKVPLLRNYYYHQYIAKGAKNYLLVFDDYIAGSFEANVGVDVVFYGFYSNLPNGFVVAQNATQEDAKASVVDFIRQAYNENWMLNAYTYFVNVLSVVPYTALMIMITALLSYSLLRLLGVESVNSLGAMFKIVGAFVWFTGFVSALFSLVAGFFLKRSLITALTLVVFFVVLVARTVAFVLVENKLHKKQLEQQKTEQVGD